MAAVWAESCAEEILNEWGNTSLRMKNLIADALDMAEEKGYERGYGTRDEELAQVEVDPKVIRSACVAAAKHPMGGGSQKEPRCSYPYCETDEQDSHYPCNCPVAVRAAFEALVTRSPVGG